MLITYQTKSALTIFLTVTGLETIVVKSHSSLSVIRLF